MKLETVDVALIRKAVAVFLELAWGDLADRHWPRNIDFEGDSRNDVLGRFVDECKRGCMRKYSLRLGNRRYPFMKVLFQELLFRDCFFFSVDTHDELDIKETTPDYQEWLAIRGYNAELKVAVEEAWQVAGIPTLTDILDRVEEDEVPAEQLCSVDPQPVVFVVDGRAPSATLSRSIRAYRLHLLARQAAADCRFRRHRTSSGSPHTRFSRVPLGSCGGCHGFQSLARGAVN